MSHGWKGPLYRHASAAILSWLMAMNYADSSLDSLCRLTVRACFGRRDRAEIIKARRATGAALDALDDLVGNSFPYSQVNGGSVMPRPADNRTSSVYSTPRKSSALMKWCASWKWSIEISVRHAIAVMKRFEMVLSRQMQHNEFSVPLEVTSVCKGFDDCLSERASFARWPVQLRRRRCWNVQIEGGMYQPSKPAHMQ